MGKRLTAEERRQKQHEAALQWVMSTEQGRYVMSHLIEHCGVWRSSYNPERQDIHHVLFNEGQRNLGLYLMSELQHAALGSFKKMIDEHSDPTNTNNEEDNDETD